MDRFADGLDKINRAVGGVVMWAALAMVLMQFGIVLLRYVFGFTSIFFNESVLYLHAALFMLGAGYTLLLGGHVRVDIFYAPLSAKAKAMVDIFGHLCLMLPSLGILLYYSWPSVRRSWAILEGPISVGGVPASFLLKSLIPAFCVLLLVQGLSALIRDVLRLGGGN
ncbi:TRAP transporter small permease subunit [Pseudorhodobacter sp. E13]|uniref:TRAP transporter small permease subunit n=1 Tax=Pseudorhodobacter sp. E13 TaxID=2487931 RepID=UPI000F8CB859|nr:TRAP transporter small permease subunit [Pseudorhodobacter sp. E13]RUS59360.1 TRAP transporter small permease subunit [Pseudorhodobacter sp. E13]